MNSPVIQPYLFFGGRCEEAIAFYESALGAKVGMKMHYNEAPESPPPGMLPDGYETKIMHAEFTIGENVLMASDGCGEMPTFDGFSLSITLPTQDEARKAFNALADGGNVTMPLGETFWSPLFGMVTDRFGLGWMINVSETKA
jgi:PhnB protein